jgi:putative lipase involved disintegration of autophagic bodies
MISFRGSANIQNVIEDINVQMVPYDCKGCAVHAGFLEDYRLIEAKVDAKVTELLQKYPKARILATGHSLGGALS